MSDELGIEDVTAAALIAGAGLGVILVLRVAHGQPRRFLLIAGVFLDAVASSRTISPSMIADRAFSDAAASTVAGYFADQSAPRRARA